MRFHVVWGDGCPAETGCLGDVEEGGGCSWRNGAIGRWHGWWWYGGSEEEQERSTPGQKMYKRMRVEQCYSWPRERAGPRNGSFKPRTLAFCIFLSPWKSYRQSWQFGFNSIWTDVNRYYLSHIIITMHWSILFNCCSPWLSLSQETSVLQFRSWGTQRTRPCTMLPVFGQMLGEVWWTGGDFMRGICASRDQWLQLVMLSLTWMN